MNIQQCQAVIERYRLPQTPFVEWSTDKKEVLCMEYYAQLEYKPYDYNPWSQGEMLCESLGLSVEHLDSIRQSMYLNFEGNLDELVWCVIEDKTN